MFLHYAVLPIITIQAFTLTPSASEGGPSRTTRLGICLTASRRLVGSKAQYPRCDHCSLHPSPKQLLCRLLELPFLSGRRPVLCSDFLRRLGEGR